MTEHPRVFDHVGLLFNEPPAVARCPLFSRPTTWISCFRKPAKLFARTPAISNYSACRSDIHSIILHVVCADSDGESEVLPRAALMNARQVLRPAHPNLIQRYRETLRSFLADYSRRIDLSHGRYTVSPDSKGVRGAHASGADFFGDSRMISVTSPTWERSNPPHLAPMPSAFLIYAYCTQWHDCCKSLFLCWGKWHFVKSCQSADGRTMLQFFGAGHPA